MLGVAVSVTDAFCAIVVAQAAGQLIPPTLEVTAPAPLTPTVSANVPVGAAAKLAVTPAFAFMAIWQVPLPLHPPPLQPVNCWPASGTAVSVTDVPWA